MAILLNLVKGRLPYNHTCSVALSRRWTIVDTVRWLYSHVRLTPDNLTWMIQQRKQILTSEYTCVVHIDKHIILIYVCDVFLPSLSWLSSASFPATIPCTVVFSKPRGPMLTPSKSIQPVHW